MKDTLNQGQVLGGSRRKGTELFMKVGGQCALQHMELAEYNMAEVRRENRDMSITVIEAEVDRALQVKRRSQKLTQKFQGECNIVETGKESDFSCTACHGLSGSDADIGETRLSEV